MYLFIVVTFAFNSNPSVIVYVSLLGSSCWHFVWSRVGCAHSFEVTLVLPYFLDFLKLRHCLLLLCVRRLRSIIVIVLFYVFCFVGFVGWFTGCLVGRLVGLVILYVLFVCLVRWLVYWLLS